MPTGYTADVQNGKITTLREFALRCARNFGALVMMRDDDMDAPIPEEFGVDSHHVKALVEAESALATFMAATDDRLRVQQAGEVAESRKDAREGSERYRQERARYEAMIAKVEAWTPPSPDHNGMKEFMLDQLRESIRFDCGDYVDRQLNEPIQPFAEWKAKRSESLNRDVAYHTVELAKERERVAARNLWIKLLRESL